MRLHNLSNIIRLRPNAEVAGTSRLGTGKSGGERMAQNRIQDSTSSPGRDVGWQTVLLGMDFGASHARIVGKLEGMEELYLRRNVPSVIAVMANDDTPNSLGFLHVGADAIDKKGDRFRRLRPWQNGDIADPVMARELARHVRGMMRRSELLHCRAVVAEPSSMSADGRHHLRQALRGLFQEVVFLPRAYLAGLALERQNRDSRSEVSGCSLLVDLGAGTTEGVVIGEHYHGAATIQSADFGGDHVDEMILKALRKDYPAFRPAPDTVRAWKEEFGFVGDPVSTIAVKVPLDGVEREIVLTSSLRHGCEAWLVHVAELIESLVSQAVAIGQRPDRVFLTGGGSQLLNLVPILIETLAHRGLAGMRFEIVKDSGMSLAAMGALEAAQRVREDQWPCFALD